MKSKLKNCFPSNRNENGNNNGQSAKNEKKTSKMDFPFSVKRNGFGHITAVQFLLVYVTDGIFGSEI